MGTTSIVSEHASGLDLHCYYPGFSPAEVPSGTSARRAWIGSLQPFEDDESSRLLLRALDENRAVQIDRGTVRVISYPDVSHPLEKLLTTMRVSFQLLLLEFAPPVHPRVYGLKPRISQQLFPAHPHLRGDQRIEYGGARLPALCVYSAADFKYIKEIPPLVEFLDQTATFLAKQLIWIRTRRFFDLDTGRLIYAPPSGDRILDLEPRVEDNVPGVSRYARRATGVWRGYWPGDTAPAGPAAHVATIAPYSECWCGRGLLYRDCHLPYEKRPVLRR
jgi:SEC-C motif-containing protein